VVTTLVAPVILPAISTPEVVTFKRLVPPTVTLKSSAPPKPKVVFPSPVWLIYSGIVIEPAKIALPLWSTDATTLPEL